jgi:hypothetical protein
MIHTACWRGYYCTYALDNGEFYLATLTLCEKNANYLPVDGVAPKISDGEAFYESLRVRVPFTGRILLGKVLSEICMSIWAFSALLVIKQSLRSAFKMVSLPSRLIALNKSLRCEAASYRSEPHQTPKRRSLLGSNTPSLANSTKRWTRDSWPRISVGSYNKRSHSCSRI